MVGDPYAGVGGGVENLHAKFADAAFETIPRFDALAPLELFESCLMPRLEKSDVLPEPQSSEHF
jgi:hypothetical protein